ncbi:MAG: VOC family protein [Pseudomonadota bacterium]
MPALSGFDHLVLTVADIPEAVAFYTAALGMTHERFPVKGEERHALIFASHKINLHRAGAEFLPHASAPVPGSADLCLLTEAPLAEWVAHLAGLGIAIEEGPVPRTGARGPITSIYLRDPDGNLLEIARYD